MKPALTVESPGWFQAPATGPYRIVTAAPPPRLAKKPAVPPLASQAPTVVAKNYPKTMAKLTSQPPVPARRVAEKRRYSSGSVYWWNAGPSWRGVWPAVLVIGWMVGLTWYLDRLERSALQMVAGECSMAVVRP